MITTLLRIIAGVFTLSLWHLAYGIPFSVTPASGFRGDTVEVSLLDANTQNFEAATLFLAFDPTRLTFLDALGGDLADASSVFSVEQAPGQWLISLAASVPPSSNEQGSLLTTRFNILGTAPFGDTPVTFGCTLPTHNPSDPNCSVDYDVPPTSGLVTVLQSTGGGTVPEPSSLVLVVIVMAIAVKMRGRAKRFLVRGRPCGPLEAS